MRLFILSALSSLIISQCYSESPKENDIKFECQISEGLRKDDLTWSTRGKNGHPNVLSELDFKDIKIANTHLQSKLTTKYGFIRADLAYGNIYKGRMSDRDYLNDNRKLMFSYSDNHHITGKYTFDAAIAFGKDFAISEKFNVSPLVGYGYDVQSYRIRKGISKRHLTIYGISRFKHKINGLNSTFRSMWDAPFIGCKADYSPIKKLKVFGEYDFIFALKYHSKSYWNLRHAHFSVDSKRSKGFGHNLQVGCDYEVFNKVHLIGEYIYKWMEAKGGTERTKENGHTFRQPFRKAKLRSSEVRLTLQFDL